MHFILHLVLFFLEAATLEVDLIDDIHVNTETQAFTDSFNRERYFHGTNIVFKTFPWYPDGNNGNTFDETDMQYLSSIGMNVVRLGINWAGVMPTLGDINYTYLEVIGRIVRKMEKYGISTILDSHQDLINEEFCGNGFPKLNKTLYFPFPLDIPYTKSVKNPSTTECYRHYWAFYYLTYAVSSTFEDLYTNGRNLTAYYSQHWETIAQYFKDFKSVIGYNLINEPSFGNFYKNLKLLFPWNANKRILKFQDVIAQGIRKFDNKKIIFFEGVTTILLSTGFEYVPGGSDYQNRSCLSYHYYRPPNISPWLTVSVHDHDARRLSTGRMLTEFFAHSRKQESRYEVHNVIKSANSKLHSWISWQYKCFYQPNQNSDECDTFNSDRNNTFDVNITDTIQIYPMIVAGKTVSFSYDPDNNKFHMMFLVASNMKNTTTVIYIGEYASDLHVTATCSYLSQKSGNYFIVEYKDCRVGTVFTINN